MSVSPETTDGITVAPPWLGWTLTSSLRFLKKPFSTPYCRNAAGTPAVSCTFTVACSPSAAPPPPPPPPQAVSTSATVMAATTAAAPLLMPFGLPARKKPNPFRRRLSGMSHKWTATDIPSQSGRTIVVTGANSGIGLVAARALAGAGAKVVLAVRDTAKGASAAGTIAGDTEVRALDLADLASVRDVRRRVGRRPGRAGQQRRRDGRAPGAHQGRLRDADRHQPPRPLRADQPAAAEDHRPRGHARLGRPPDRRSSTWTT